MFQNWAHQEQSLNAVAGLCTQQPPSLDLSGWCRRRLWGFCSFLPAYVLKPVLCYGNTQFGIPLPHDTGVQCLELRKEEGSSEEQQISQNPRSCLSLPARPPWQQLGKGSCFQCLCLSPCFTAVSDKFWLPWWRASFGASRIHVWWQGGRRRTRRAVWVCNWVNCRSAFVFITSEQDVGRCSLVWWANTLSFTTAA